LYFSITLDQASASWLFQMLVSKSLNFL